MPILESRSQSGRYHGLATLSAPKERHESGSGRERPGAVFSVSLW